MTNEINPRDVQVLMNRIAAFGKGSKEIRSFQKLAEEHRLKAQEHRLRADYIDKKWMWMANNREALNCGSKQHPYPEHLKSFDNFRRQQFRLNTQPFEKPAVTEKQFLERFSKRKQERHWET